jgi:hypothetical protein
MITGLLLIGGRTRWKHNIAFHYFKRRNEMIQQLKRRSTMRLMFIFLDGGQISL